MSFADLQQHHRQLSLRLRVHAGERAFAEITVGAPTGDCDELSFIRLVGWSYVLFQETGRVALRFLKDLPPLAGSDLSPEVLYLRTWATHNLLPDKPSDREKLVLAWSWLKRACGTSSPIAADEWRSCFRSLCDRVSEVLQLALKAAEALDSPDDGTRLLEELRRRLDRNWEAYRFDERVASVQRRLNFDGLDTVSLRTKHLDSWRKVVAAASEDAIERVLEQRIEKDLLDLMNAALPMVARDVLEQVAIGDGRELGALMLALRARARVSRDGVAHLLEEVAKEMGNRTVPALGDGQSP